MVNRIKTLVSLMLLFISLPTIAQQLTTGIVKDARTGIPLAGVSISSNNENRGVTDNNGRFSINISSNLTYLEFSSIGYNRFRLDLTTETDYIVSLEPNDETMEEVVVVGYGTQTRSKVTGSVSSLNMEGLEDKPTVNIAQSLRGTVAGVQVLDNGRPGQDPTILIRGQRSLSAN